MSLRFITAYLILNYTYCFNEVFPGFLEDVAVNRANCKLKITIVVIF